MTGYVQNCLNNSLDRYLRILVLATSADLSPFQFVLFILCLLLVRRG